MKVTTSVDQIECALILTTMGALEVFRPVPPCQITDGILQLDADCWLVGTNNRGNYTLHVLEECTKDEAFKFFDDIRQTKGEGRMFKSCNPRLHYVGPSAAPSAN